MPDTVLIRTFNHLQPYEHTLAAMRSYTDNRQPTSLDEIWILQHLPVFTQGQAGKQKHVLSPENIPIVHSDRGGQVTYHGPGQWVFYFLLDLKRLKMGVRALVRWIESSLIQTLAAYDVQAYAKDSAPGVYLRPPNQVEAKIASLGLRVRNGRCFHGLALNVDMDLSPFKRINPCGYANLPMTQLVDATQKEVTLSEVAKRLLEALLDSMPYAHREEIIED